MRISAAIQGIIGSSINSNMKKGVSPDPPKRIKLKRRKTAKSTNPARPKLTANPCQSKPIDFQRLFVEDHANHAGLARLYLDKLNEVEKRSSKRAKNSVDLEHKAKLLEKQLDYQISSYDQLRGQYCALEEENERLKADMAKLQQVHEATLRNQQLRAERDEMISAKYLDNTVNSRKQEYVKILPAESNRLNEPGTAPFDRSTNKFDRTNSTKCDPLKSTKRIETKGMSAYFAKDKSNLEDKLAKLGEQNRKLRLCVSDYRF